MRAVAQYVRTYTFRLSIFDVRHYSSLPNSVGADQKPLPAASDQGQHCLQSPLNRIENIKVTGFTFIFSAIRGNYLFFFFFFFFFFLTKKSFENGVY